MYATSYVMIEATSDIAIEVGWALTVGLVVLSIFVAWRARGWWAAVIGILVAVLLVMAPYATFVNSLGGGPHTTQWHEVMIPYFAIGGATLVVDLLALYFTWPRDPFGLGRDRRSHGP